MKGLAAVVLTLAVIACLAVLIATGGHSQGVGKALLIVLLIIFVPAAMRSRHS